MNSIMNEKWDVGLRVFILFVRGIFKERPAGDFHWEDDDTTEIFIGGSEAEEGNSKLPRIIVSRGAINFAGLSPSQAAPRMFARTESTVADLQSSLITITAAAGLPTEAHCLAMHIFSMLVPFREMLARQGGFHAIQTNNASASTPMPLTNFFPGSLFGSLRAVQIGIPVFMQETKRVDDSAFYTNIERYVLSEIKSSS